MLSESAEAKSIQPPSPESLEELIGALKAAGQEVSEARRQVEADYTAQVERLRSYAEKGLATTQATCC